MFKVNDFVVYSTHGVCQVTAVEEKPEEEKTYYTLRPINKTLTIKTANTDEIRLTLSKAEVKRLIQMMPEVEATWINDARRRSRTFRNLLKTGKCGDLIRIVKAIYTKNQENKKTNKKLSLQDKEIYQTAYNRLLDEFSFALKMPRQEVDDHILKLVDQA